jgi:hypothetical protein
MHIYVRILHICIVSAYLFRIILLILGILHIVFRILNRWIREMKCGRASGWRASFVRLHCFSLFERILNEGNTLSIQELPLSASMPTVR